MTIVESLLGRKSKNETALMCNKSGKALVLFS